MKINKNNIIKEKGLESIFQISILIIATFAFAYFVYQGSGLVDELIEEIDEMLPSASAQENDALYCCPETKDNAICQNVLGLEYAERCSISNPPAPATCDQLPSCEIGCCFDEQNGLCSPNSPKGKCKANRGEWSADSSCNTVSECDRGCCIINNNPQFLTEAGCKKQARDRGMDWKEEYFHSNILTEPECLYTQSLEAEGACIIEGENRERTCEYVTGSECRNMIGVEEARVNFREGLLCSNPILETNCEPTEQTTCVEGKDEVYFVDSCGNIANIYDARFVRDIDYWKTKISKQDSCNKGESNAESRECGNCNKLLGSYCELGGNTQHGDYYCKDMDCRDENGNKRKHGESWCYYEGAVGGGKDVVGSRHFVRRCVDGEVKTEPCSDYRNAICVQGETELPDNEGVFQSASCRPNMWQMCNQKNIESAEAKENKDENYNLTKECIDNPDCELTQVRIANKFKFDFCTPKYPPGFNIKSETNMEMNSKLCGLATQECVVVYKKNWRGKWKCKINCDCEDRFLQEMHDLCIKLGDCGGYVNIEGEITEDGFSITGHKAESQLQRFDLRQYREFARTVAGQFAEPGNLSQIMAETGQVMPEGVSEEELISMEAEKMMKTMGAFGSVMGAASSYMGWGVITSAINAGNVGWTTLLSGKAGVAGFLYGLEGLVGAFGAAAIGTAIGGAIGYFLGGFLGLENEGLMAITLAGAIGGALIGISTFIEGGFVAGLAGPWGLAGIAIAIVVGVWTAITGWGKTKKKIMKFTCSPWQPPAGGSDCDKCNKDFEDLGIPCSRYRCQSLGAACEFVNEGTGEEDCIWNNPNDVSAPVIKPWQEILSEGYKYTQSNSRGVQIRTNDNSCIPEFTPVLFGVQTDEPAQCKISFDSGKSYSEMESHFGESSIYKQNHTNAFNMPSAEAFLSQFDEEDRPEYIHLLDKLGEVNMNVKCRDYNGNENPVDYRINFCVKPGADNRAPWITKTDPESPVYLAYEQTEQKLDVYVNEPATCKYSNRNQDYELMENSMECQTDLADMKAYGWPCNTTLTNLDQQDKIYIKCMDQPWLIGTVNESNRNAMQTSDSLAVIEFIKTETPLKITSIKPEKDKIIFAESQPTTIELEVETSGGVENGKSECKYKFSEEGNYIQMFNTFDDIHTTSWNQIVRGDYNVYVKCKDIANNIALNETSFIVDVDETAPNVIRVYNDYGDLKIITNEDAVCYFGDENCDFAIEEGHEMSHYGEYDIEHTIDWNEDYTYFIKCQDKCNNYISGCSIIVRPYYKEEWI